MKRLIKTIISVIIVLFCVFMTPLVSTFAATTTDSLPITSYSLNSTVTTYKSTNGDYSGYISKSDLCTILELYESGWLKVKYPISRGYKIAYAKSSSFFSNIDFNASTITLEKKLSVYRHSNLSVKLGTVYANDSVIIVDNNGKNTQIIYPITGGYKMGWIEGVYTSSIIPDGYYKIKSVIDPTYVIDINGASKEDCANVQLFRDNGGDNQLFYCKRIFENFYTITSKLSGKVLDVEGGCVDSGANIIQYTLNGNGSDNQLWELQKNSDGSFSFQSKLSGMYLDVYGGIAENGNNIHCWEKNETAAQKFILESISIDADYTDAQKAVSEKLNSLITQYSGTTWNDYYYGIQCKGFGNLIFAKLFGPYIGAYDTTTKSYIPNPTGANEVGRLSEKNMTQNSAKELLKKGQPGDYIQVRRRNKTYGHTMILVNSDSNGITVFDCNSDGKNGVKTYYITWKQFYEKNSAMSLYHAKNYN